MKPHKTPLDTLLENMIFASRTPLEMDPEASQKIAAARIAILVHIQSRVDAETERCAGILGRRARDSGRLAAGALEDAAEQIRREARA